MSSKKIRTPRPARVEYSKDSAGEYRASFIARNGETVGVLSEGYTTLAAAIKGVAALRRIFSAEDTITKKL